MKQFLWLYLMLALFLAGCATLQDPIEPFTPSIYQGDLWKIRIGSEDTELFSGILVLAKIESRLSFQLLDATGITLLSASADKEGSVHLQQAVPKVREGRLPLFLATSLQRVFFDNGKNCYWAEPTTMRCKKVRWGMFSHWQVVHHFDEQTQEIVKVDLDQWWPKPDLSLEKL